MKHCILLLAFQSKKYIESVINQFDNSFDFFIHIDKNSEISNDDIIQIQNIENVRFCNKIFESPRYSFNLVEAELTLLKEAFQFKYDFYHLMSENCLMFRPLDDFKGFFEKEENHTSFIDIKNIYDYTFCPDIKHKNKVIKRNKYIDFHQGSQWWSFYKDLVFDIFNNSKLKMIKNACKRAGNYDCYNFCPDETFFQTYIMTTNFKNYKNYLLRYVYFHNEFYTFGNNINTWLNENDFHSIKYANCFWCRKVALDTELYSRLYGLKNKKIINTNKDKLDIFICTHKDFNQRVWNECYKVIDGGETENNTFIHGNTLDNVAYKDKAYSEMRHMYWVWKNYQLKKYVGFTHYRRYFSFFDNIPENIDEIIDKYGVIVGESHINHRFNKIRINYERPTWICDRNLRGLENNYDTFDKTFAHQIIDEYEIIIKEDFPDIYPFFLEFFYKDTSYINNFMFIMKSEDFKEFCEFMFAIQDAYDKKYNCKTIDDYKKRIKKLLSKFLSPNISYLTRYPALFFEQFLNIFIKMKGYTPYEIDRFFVDPNNIYINF